MSSCVLYGLHKRLNLGERQASRLRAKQDVQGMDPIPVFVTLFLISNAIRSECFQGISILPLG